MNQSEHINELAKALSEAQGEFPVLEKKSKAYNYNYADLAETLQATQDILRKHGLSVVHQVKLDNIMTTKLMHSSGQWLSSDMPLCYKADGKVNAMQALGSAITYAKRYSIGCLLNLAADKEIDDDGEKSAPKTSNVRLPKILSEQVEIVEEYLKEFPESKKDMLAKFGIERIQDIPYDKFEWVVSVFEKKRSANG